MSTLEIIECRLEEFLGFLGSLDDFYETPSIEEASDRIGYAQSLALLAKLDGEIVGCKLGYALPDENGERVFYSWLGGVNQGCRKQGVASSLLDYQEQWLKTQGYTEVRVKSMNHYPNMLRFLIKKGYQVTGVEPGVPEKLKVHFSKKL